MSSSESDAETPLSESAGQESKRSTSSLGCGFITLAFEEFLAPLLIVAVCRGDEEKWLIVYQLVAIFLVHVAFQYFLIDEHDPVNVGLEAIQDDMEHADFQQLFDQLHSAAPSIEHIAVGIKKGGKFIVQAESKSFAFTSWRDVSDPVSGRDGPSAEREHYLEVHG